MEDKKEDIVEQVREETRKFLEDKKKEGEETGEEILRKVDVGLKVSKPEQAPQRPKEIPFFNATDLKFNDISHEQIRQYLFANGAKIGIEYPLKLGISRDNVHRVFDSTGLSYFIPPNWISIVTKPKPGGPDIIM